MAMVQKNRLISCEITSCKSNDKGFCTKFFSTCIDCTNKDGKKCFGFEEDKNEKKEA